MSAQKFGFGPREKSRPQLATASSLSLRWRVMLLAMSMVAMVVVLMAVAVYAVVSRALYDDIDNQLHSRARLLIESGSLAADPARPSRAPPIRTSTRCWSIPAGPSTPRTKRADAAAWRAGEGCGAGRSC